MPSAEARGHTLIRILRLKIAHLMLHWVLLIGRGQEIFLSGQIAKFDRNLNFTWEASDFTLGGIILTNGADLTLDRPNNGDNPAFTISGQCISIGSGSILNLIYITSLSNFTICIEEGGKLILDSRNGGRNTFTFDAVEINLQGPNAAIEFGDAEINIVGEDGLEINGWTGTEVCENGNAPESNGSGNITWTNETANICDLLNLRVLPIQWAAFSARYEAQIRLSNLTWSTTSEWENSHFEVQRSVNDVRSWETIASVKGAGYSDQPVDYAFQDLKLPIAGGNIFYRIRQVDLNGNATFSDTEAIRVEPIPGTTYWSVYPNPTTGDTINLEQLVTARKNDTKVLVRVISSSGQVDMIEGYAATQLSPLLSDVMKRKKSRTLYARNQLG
ncbi:hypothetical protein [Algoriphagus boritolerans]|uniref:hypothetical protein n=1 Tax=Algoriphagus boritolerans TaxID=308111 RepID=UPI002FCE480C